MSKSVIATIRRWKHEVQASGTEELHDAEKRVAGALETLRAVDAVITEWRTTGREPAYGQWLTMQDKVQGALRDCGA